jgi:hypothetical protein
MTPALDFALHFAILWTASLYLRIRGLPHWFVRWYRAQGYAKWQWRGVQVATLLSGIIWTKLGLAVGLLYLSMMIEDVQCVHLLPEDMERYNAMLNNIQAAPEGGCPHPGLPVPPDAATDDTTGQPPDGSRVPKLLGFPSSEGRAETPPPPGRA